MHHERSERHVRADRAYPLDDHRERRGRVLLLGKGAVLTQRVAGPLAAELDEKQHRAAECPHCCFEASGGPSHVPANAEAERAESEPPCRARRAH